MVFLSHSQENNSDFVLVHDDELIGILERDAAALDSEPGSSAVCQTLYDRVIGELKKPNLRSEIKFQLLNKTVDILANILRDGFQDDPHLNLSPSIEIRPLISGLGHSKEKGHQETAQQFVEHFTDRKCKSPFFFCEGLNPLVLLQVPSSNYVDTQGQSGLSHSLLTASA